MERWHRCKSFPLHIHISTFALLLVFCLGSTLIIYNYYQASQLIRSAASDLFEHSRQNITLEFQRSYAPVAQTVHLLSATGLVTATDYQSRMEYLPLLIIALDDQPELAALEVAYQDGDYFIARVLPDEHTRQVFQAPAEAHYLVDNIQSGPEKPDLQRVFLDAQARPLSEPEQLETRYDPRKRDWYRQAHLAAGDGRLTEPYLYYFIRKPGVTYAQASADGRAVVAGDIALDALSASVHKQAVYAGSHLLLLDNQQGVIAYNRRDDSVFSATDEQVRLMRLEDLQQPLLNLAAAQLSGGEQEFQLQHNDQVWQGVLKPVEPIPEARFQLLLLTPEPVLLARAYKIREESTLLALALLAAFFPLIWLIARRVTRALRRLVWQSQEIQRFHLGYRLENRSRIKEIAELATAMGLMQQTLRRFIRQLEDLNQESEQAELISLLTRKLQQITGYAGVLLYLPDDEDKQKLYLAGAGYRSIPSAANLPESVSLQLDSVLAGSCQARCTRASYLRAEDPLIFGALGKQLPANTRVLAVPLISGHIRGVLVLLESAGEPEPAADNRDLSSADVASEQQQAFVEALAGFAASCLGRAEPVRSVRRKQHTEH